MSLPIRLKSPPPGAPAPAWDKFERKGDAVELYGLAQKEEALDQAISSLTGTDDARWAFLRRLDGIVGRRIFLEGRLRA